MRILLTNNHMIKFGGSELVTLELAEYFTALGHTVVVYSPNLGQPLLESASKDVVFVDMEPQLHDWDIVWCHHNLLINRLRKGNVGRIICNHMSSYVDMERPNYDAGKPDLILANSRETIFSMPLDHSRRAMLFQNPAPMKFHTANKRREYGLFISNHRPKGLSDIDLDLPLRFIGERDEFTRVKPKHFEGAAFVVCNGKSVQYALRAGVPVFLYDSFGGPGWLTRDNFRTAEYYNFSGRGFTHHDDTPYSLGLWEEARPIPQQRVLPRFKLEEVIERLGVLSPPSHL